MTAFLVAFVDFSEKILVLLATWLFLEQLQVPESFKSPPNTHLDTHT